MENELEYDDNGVKKDPKWVETLKRIWDSRSLKKRTEFATLAAAFCHKQKDALVVLADPETDVLFVAYDDQFAVNRITDVTGKSMKVVKKALKGNQESIQNFVTYVAAAIAKNHEEISQRYIKGPRLEFKNKQERVKYYEQLKGLKIEKSQRKKEIEKRKNELYADQQKIDQEAGLKETGIQKLKDLFRRRIVK